VKEDKAYQQKQELLRKKHGLQNKNVVVVEKNNTIKFLVKTLAAVIRLVATVAILSFAVLGLVAIVYPSPRLELLYILNEALAILRDYMSGLI